MLFASIVSLLSVNVGAAQLAVDHAGTTTTDIEQSDDLDQYGLLQQKVISGKAVVSANSQQQQQQQQQPWKVPVSCGFNSFAGTTTEDLNLNNYGVLVEDNAVIQGHTVEGTLWAGESVFALFDGVNDQSITWGKNGDHVWYGSGFRYDKKDSDSISYTQKTWDSTLWSNIQDFASHRDYWGGHSESCRVSTFHADGTFHGGNADDTFNGSPEAWSSGNDDRGDYRVVVVNQDVHFDTVSQPTKNGKKLGETTVGGHRFTMSTLCQGSSDPWKRYFRRDLYAEDGTRTLVIFTGKDTVILGRSPGYFDAGHTWHNSVKKWGATVIAPLAKVICEAGVDDGGFCDGAIVAKGLDVAERPGQNAKGQQLHGDWYTGYCPDTTTTTTVDSTTATTTAQTTTVYKKLTGDACHTLVATDDCAIHPKNIYGPVYCGGDLSVSGNFMHSFMGKVHANNGANIDGSLDNEVLKNANGDVDIARFSKGISNKGDVSTTFPEFSTLQAQHSVFLTELTNDAYDYFTSTLSHQNWHAFGTTSKSFWKTCGGYRCVVHVVDKAGTFNMNYQGVLTESGLEHQKKNSLTEQNQPLQEPLRWCETNDAGKCLQNGERETYQDNIEGQRTLVVFTNAIQVTLKPTSDGRKWGASVFAPSTKVALQSDFADGQLIVEELIGTSTRTGDQLHGKCFEESILSYDE